MLKIDILDSLKFEAIMSIILLIIAKYTSRHLEIFEANKEKFKNSNFRKIN